MTNNRILLIAIAATWLIGGFVEPFTPSFGQVYNEATLPHAIVLSFLLFAWCKSDAYARGVKPPVGAPLLVGFVSPVGVPYYYLRLLPFRKAMISIGKALLFALLCVLISAGAQFVALRLAT